MGATSRRSSISTSACAPRWASAESGQPALAAPVALRVAVGFAAADVVQAEVELLDVGILRERLGAAFEHDAAGLDDVAMVRELERERGVLLHQQHRDALGFRQPPHDAENLLGEHRREAERGL